MTTPHHRRLLLLVAAVAGTCIYACGFIYRTSYVVDGVRHFGLFDDAMISMTYARNLAHGQGLVWNPGAMRVEGFTNPLWTLLMAGLHLLPMSADHQCLAVQVVGVALLVLNLLAVSALAVEVGADGTTHAGAVLLVATFYPLVYWTLIGMEVGLLALLITVVLWRSARALRLDAFDGWTYVLLGTGFLVRMDAAVVWLVVVGYLAVAQPRFRRHHLLVGLGGLVLLGAVLTGLRVAYYGDVLPNTYYLKVTGIPLLARVVRGTYALVLFLIRCNVLLWVGAVAVAWTDTGGRLRLPCLVFVVQAIYGVWTGGDAWEWHGGSNRYVTVAVPGLMVAMAVGLQRLAQQLPQIATGRAGASGTRLVGACFAALLGYAVLSCDAFYGVHHRFPLAEALLLQPPAMASESAKAYRDASELAQLTRPGATIALILAGGIPYRLEGRVYVDLLGKMDRHVARIRPTRAPGPMGLIGWVPGHNKYDHLYMLKHTKPDVVRDLWSPWWDPAAARAAQRYLEENYVRADVGWFRRGSMVVDWAAVSAHQTAAAPDQPTTSVPDGG